MRRLVDAGAPLTAAVTAATTTPARLLGRGDLGMVLPGMPAHLAVLDDETLAVRRTLVHGHEVFAA